MAEADEELGVRDTLKRCFDKTGLALLSLLLAGAALSLYTGLYAAAGLFVVLAVAALVCHQKLAAQNEYTNDLLYTALEGSPDGVLFLDTDLNCSYCNGQASNMLGLAVEEIKGRELLSLIGNNSETAALNRELETIERVLRTGNQETVFEAVFYRQKKKAFPVEYRASVIQKNRVIIGVLLFFRDVTAQRRMETLLNEKVDVLEGLEKRGKIGFWEWNIAKKELYMSKQFRRYLSHELKDPVIEDASFLHYVHGEDLPLFNEKLRSSLSSHRIIELTFRTLPQQGLINVLHCVGRTQYDQLNQPVKVNGFCVDVSDKTRLESLIKKQEQELAILKSRSPGVERSPHAVDTLRFLTGMSHDLRTPLNSILGFAQLHLQKTHEPGGNELEKKNCQRIIESGKHLLQLISDVIDYAKIEAKELSLTLASYSLAGVVRETYEICGVEARQKGVKLTLEPQLAEDVVWIFVDRDRLRQVMVNLLLHIIGFCKAGGEVKIHCTYEEGGMVRVDIVDVNHVIPLEKVAPIFSDVEQPGEQGKMQEMELRLAIAKQLIIQMNGTILLESDTEKGNIFSLHLQPAEPGEKTEIHSKDKEGAVEQPVDTTDQAVSDYLILNIEDNASNRQLVKSILKRNVNYQLLEAENGASGLQLAQEKRPHCILLDLNLPDMSGYDVIESLKNDSRTSTIPVVALSGEVSDHTKETLELKGFESFISKPINVAEFRQTVERVLNR